MVIAASGFVGRGMVQQPDELFGGMLPGIGYPEGNRIIVHPGSVGKQVADFHLIGHQIGREFDLGQVPGDGVIQLHDPALVCNSRD